MGAIEPAVRLYEEAPGTGTTVQTPWSDVWLSPTDWAEAFGAPDPGTPHNPAREQVWEALVTILLDRHDDDVPADPLRRSLAQDEDLVGAFDRCWPLLEPTDVVGDRMFEEVPRVRSLSPETAKGLEFDLVVLVDPAAFGTGTGTGGAVDRYVAMTRATQQLVVLTGRGADQTEGWGG